MTGYEYGNARLHAMKSRLLNQKELEMMIQAGSVQGLIAALTKTSYRKSIENALARSSGIECVTEALHYDLIDTLGNIRSFYINQPGEMVALALRAYDIHNLKSIFRGLSRNAPAGEILATLFPVGELKYPFLVELANATDLRAAIDLIASLVLPFAHPLLNVRAAHPGADEFEMELALDQWYYTEVQRILTKKSSRRDKLTAFFDLEADLANLLTVLRFIHAPTEFAFLSEHTGSESLSRLFVGPGRLSFELLERASAQGSMDSSVAALEGTPYAVPLSAGLDLFSRSGRLSDIEKALHRYRLEWLVQLFHKDALGIGVVLGYIGLKINEISNISWIAHAANLGLNAEAIRANVEWTG